MPLGLAFFPIVVHIFFGRQCIEVSIHDADVKEKLESFFSPKHLQLAKLMKEHIQQQQNDGKGFDIIINRVFGHACKSPSKNSKFATAGYLAAQHLDLSLFPVFNLPGDKWKDYQATSCVFFVGNPNPVRQPLPSSSPSSSPAAAFTNVPINARTQSNQQPFDAMAFMQKLDASMLVSQ